MNGALVGRTILIVEDEMLVLLNIEMALGDLGCSSIFTAASVSQALALLATHHFDLAMIDVNLAGEKSYPVADALTLRGIPFAFSTGCSDYGERTDFSSRPVLRKPYVRADFEAVLTELIRPGRLTAPA